MSLAPIAEKLKPISHAFGWHHSAGSQQSLHLRAHRELVPVDPYNPDVCLPLSGPLGADPVEIAHIELA